MDASKNIIVYGLISLFILFPLPLQAEQQLSTQLNIYTSPQEIQEESVKQCFPDAKSAYEYLVQQKQRQQNLQQQAIKHQKININRATEAELIQLQGIGSTRAQDIILYRQMMGGFMSVDELTNIKGIGDKIIDNNRDRLSIVD